MEPTVVVIGLGYVGLPLAMTVARAGFKVTGFDIDPAKMTAIEAGKSYIEAVPDDVLSAERDAGRFAATTDFARLAECDVIAICVPTPLTRHREPDLSYVAKTCEQIAGTLRKGQLVVLESTTYPGTTEEVMKPILEKTGLVAGEDFFLGYSPEREDPGNRDFQTSTIPKVVAGDGEAASAMVSAFYGAVVETIVPVSGTRTAEAVKLTENVFRAVNIALVNELKIVYERMGIDVWEVIAAAKTKPFGYMPFYPGPGLGGHCIPIDPFYLTWKSREYDQPTRFIELAGYINGQMPHFVIDKIQNALNDRSKPLRGSKVHIMGMAYKRDIDDVRESPALDIALLLMQRGSEITYSDPHVPCVHLKDLDLKSVDVLEAAAASDCVVIVTDHHGVDYDAVVKAAPVIVDTRNVLKNIDSPNIVRL